MSEQSIDPAEFKSGQRREWDRVSGGWRKWWSTIEYCARPVNERLLDLAEVAAGQRVLDVATGIGEPALSAAARVGAAGRVLATDISAGMLEIARERAAEQALGNVIFQEADAELLEVAEDAFDAVLCRWGLMFLPDPAAALSRMRGLLAPGGRLAAAVWDAPQRVPFLSLPMAVVRQSLNLPPPPPGAPGLFSLADNERLASLMRQAGFTDVRIEAVAVEFEMPSAAAYVEFLQEVAGPIAALLADLPEAERAAVWQAVATAAEQHLDDGGTLRMGNTAVCVLGRA